MDKDKQIRKKAEDMLSLESAMNNISNDQLTELHNQVAKDALELKKKQIDMELKDQAADRAVEKHMNAFHGGKDLNNKLGGNSVKTQVETASGKMEIKSRSGLQCYIATSVYGDQMALECVYLRHFRDRILNQTYTGRKFVDYYYKNSPSFAKISDQNKLIKFIFLILISPIVFVSKIYYIKTRE